ncbi:hypothetical protein N431DRAFT_450526 [Stipitochalara longipes BDJ]|nr:hypothetical protein N431DRAFT_450526 [Stipitochalara longipes BDJ]
MAAANPQTPADVAAGSALETNPYWVNVDMHDLISKIDNLEDELRHHITEYGRNSYEITLRYSYGADLAKRTRFLLAQCLFQSNIVIRTYSQGVDQQLAQNPSPLSDRGPDPVLWHASNKAAVHLNTERNAWMEIAQERHMKLGVKEAQHEQRLANILARKANMLFDWALEHSFLQPGVSKQQVQSEGNRASGRLVCMNRSLQNGTWTGSNGFARDFQHLIKRHFLPLTVPQFQACRCSDFPEYLEGLRLA